MPEIRKKKKATRQMGRPLCPLIISARRPLSRRMHGDVTPGPLTAQTIPVIAFPIPLQSAPRTESEHLAPLWAPKMNHYEHCPAVHPCQ